MNWKDFFKLSVVRHIKGQEKLFWKADLAVSDEFTFEELMMSKFDHLHLSANEKKKLSLGMRKIILSHDCFMTQEFRHHCDHFKHMVEAIKEKEIVFSTQGGGIYLFIELMKKSKLSNKKIVCYTSELPLPIMTLPHGSSIQFIYRPHQAGFLSDISSLWKESELMELFELKDFKASA